MENEQYMCYITYAVPRDLMPKLMMHETEIEASSPPSLYPPGFIPDWYRNGCFPEDDFED